MALFLTFDKKIQKSIRAPYAVMSLVDKGTKRFGSSEVSYFLRSISSVRSVQVEKSAEWQLWRFLRLRRLAPRSLTLDERSLHEKFWLTPMKSSLIESTFEDVLKSGHKFANSYGEVSLHEEWTQFPKFAVLLPELETLDIQCTFPKLSAAFGAASGAKLDHLRKTLPFNLTSLSLRIRDESVLKNMPDILPATLLTCSLHSDFAARFASPGLWLERIFQKCPFLINFSSQNLSLDDKSDHTSGGIRRATPANIDLNPWSAKLQRLTITNAYFLQTNAFLLASLATNLVELRLFSHSTLPYLMKRSIQYIASYEGQRGVEGGKGHYYYFSPKVKKVKKNRKNKRKNNPSNGESNAQNNQFQSTAATALPINPETNDSNFLEEASSGEGYFVLDLHNILPTGTLRNLSLRVGLLKNQADANGVLYASTLPKFLHTLDIRIPKVEQALIDLIAPLTSLTSLTILPSTYIDDYYFRDRNNIINWSAWMWCELNPSKHEISKLPRSLTYMHLFLSLPALIEIQSQYPPTTQVVCPIPYLWNSVNRHFVVSRFPDLVMPHFDAIALSNAIDSMIDKRTFVYPLPKASGWDNVSSCHMATVNFCIPPVGKKSFKNDRILSMSILSTDSLSLSEEIGDEKKVSASTPSKRSENRFSELFVVAHTYFSHNFPLLRSLELNTIERISEPILSDLPDRITSLNLHDTPIPSNFGLNGLPRDLKRLTSNAAAFVQFSENAPHLAKIRMNYINAPNWTFHALPEVLEWFSPEMEYFHTNFAELDDYNVVPFLYRYGTEVRRNMSVGIQYRVTGAFLDGKFETQILTLDALIASCQKLLENQLNQPYSEAIARTRLDEDGGADSGKKFFESLGAYDEIKPIEKNLDNPDGKHVGSVVWCSRIEEGDKKDFKNEDFAVYLPSTESSFTESVQKISLDNLNNQTCFFGRLNLVRRRNGSGIFESLRGGRLWKSNGYLGSEVKNTPPIDQNLRLNLSVYKSLTTLELFHAHSLSWPTQWPPSLKHFVFDTAVSLYELFPTGRGLDDDISSFPSPLLPETLESLRIDCTHYLNDKYRRFNAYRSMAETEEALQLQTIPFAFDRHLPASLQHLTLKFKPSIEGKWGPEKSHVYVSHQNLSLREESKLRTIQIDSPPMFLLRDVSCLDHPNLELIHFTNVSVSTAAFQFSPKIKIDRK